MQTDITVLSHLALAARFSLGIVFLLSILPKLQHPAAFARSVVVYEVLPSGVAMIFAPILILIEAFLAIAFLTGWLADMALPLAAAILLTFVVAVEINLRRNRRIPCACFGEENERISPRTVSHLLLLLSVVLLLLVLRSEGDGTSSSLPAMIADGSSRSYLLETVCLAVSLILLTSWLLSLPELVSLARHLPRSQASSGNTGQAAK